MEQCYICLELGSIKCPECTSTLCSECDLKLKVRDHEEYWRCPVGHTRRSTSSVGEYIAIGTTTSVITFILANIIFTLLTQIGAENGCCLLALCLVLILCKIA